MAIRKLFYTTALAGLAAVAALAPKQGHAATACTTSPASLTGWYSVLIAGYATNDATNKFLVGAIYFNGVNGFAGYNLWAAAASTTSATGTFVQNTDCSFTIDFTSGFAAGQSYTVGVRKQTASNTIEAVGVEVDSTGYVATIDLQAQYATYTPNLNFTESSANGTFTAVCAGALNQAYDLNIATFSNGKISGTDPFNNGGTFDAANNPYTGTYTIYPDGTFSGTASVGSTNFPFVGVVTNAGTELQYVYFNATGGAGFSSCTAKP